MSAVNQELEEMLAAAVAGSGAGGAAGGTGKPHGGGGAIAKVGYSHEAMIDLIIARPGISQNAIAAHFGYTPSWISQIISSDAFQSALEKRREKLVDPLIAAEVQSNFKALVARSLDILQQKLNRPVDEIPDNLALRTFEIASRAAGYGAKDSAPAQPATTVEVNVHLEQLGGGLVALLQRKKREAEAVMLQPSQDSAGGDPPPLAIQQLNELTDGS